ncbi:histidine kinase [Microbacterium sp. zg.Y1090]|uniref:sensor histidine kinase n=1 Tax=Microbacterium TaxID=33882 RepID=UPI00214AA41E|nr:MULTISPECIES: histidine kinase [unclassified Microbacterium]MCR2813139.1 histidine kinase [Microbacterium sp. zg.Y1084]MCR2819452.1 histidine kinase [Microbacterium sp. zg.Y1090]MDL5487306.1 histidine kinase [Microbacterium sp. zg-Y1211]WIM28428.1 histidine kinase [Microbacterium sp. zg-Y1090]
MPDAVVIAGLVGVAVGAALALGLVFARRVARGTRDLGSDAERAEHRTLHLAAQAAAALRGGGAPADRARAARHLRTLLGAGAVAIVGPHDDVAVDGGAADADTVARRVAARVRATGRRQVFPRPQAGQPESVGAPIIVDGEPWGAVVAFADPVRAPLVRAVGDVADWCAAQLALGELETNRTALAEAELRALRAQISPHFIYNALTAIASFISTDPPRARELVLEFADFTRYSFRRQGEFTTLAEELGSIHSYLALERARFGERLAVRLRVSPETLSTVIPFLSVQPLVENAVRHGLEPGERGGMVTIASVDDGTHTEITVEDDGVGMSPEAAAALLAGEPTAGHVGLRNVDARLRQLYGPRGGLVLETNHGAGTLVRLRVPKSQPRHETGVA